MQSMYRACDLLDAIALCLARLENCLLLFWPCLQAFSNRAMEVAVVLALVAPWVMRHLPELLGHVRPIAFEPSPVAVAAEDIGKAVAAAFAAATAATVAAEAAQTAAAKSANAVPIAAAVAVGTVAVLAAGVYGVQQKRQGRLKPTIMPLPLNVANTLKCRRMCRWQLPFRATTRGRFAPMTMVALIRMSRKKPASNMRTEQISRKRSTTTTQRRRNAIMPAISQCCAWSIEFALTCSAEIGSIKKRLLPKQESISTHRNV